MIADSVTEHWIWLQSIDPLRNRRRAYALCLQLSASGAVRVRSLWGRIPRLSRHNVRQFSSYERALRHVARLLATRRRHKYQLLCKTSGFPQIPLLHDFPMAQDGRQQWLFRCDSAPAIGVGHTAGLSAFDAMGVLSAPLHASIQR